MSLVVVVVSTLLAAPGSVDAPTTPGCPEARAHRIAGDFERAEAAARRCLADAPDDVEALFELSRALGYRQAYPEALRWIDKGLDLRPGDSDLALWRIRLLAWSGALPRARQAMSAMLVEHPEVVGDRETAMLVADLHYWAHDWAAAGDALSRYLATYPGDPDAWRKRGLVHLQSGDTTRARADLEASCRLGGDRAASCADLAELERNAVVVELGLEGAIATSERGDELRTAVSAVTHPTDALRLGVAAELRLRDGGDATRDDVIVSALGAWKGDAFAIEGGVGLAPDASFSPRWSAWLEPSAALGRDLWLRMRAWRIAFAEAGATVLAPGLALQVGPVLVDLRYHLGLQDQGAPTHAVIALARVGDALWVEAGGGGGTGTDYLDATSAGGADHGHWLALVTLGWRPAARHELRLGYGLRSEWSASAPTVRRHELALAWRVGL